MKEIVEFGFAHNGKQPGEGDLAYFCAGCPQPGINLSEDWKNDPNRWKYHRSYCGDGCFSQVHQEPLTEENDIWLKSGEGFMTEKSRYAEHLASAEERKDVSRAISCVHLFLKPQRPVFLSRSLATSTGR